jgi:tRNA(His) 5'-end guanylyltransferase
MGTKKSKDSLGDRMKDYEERAFRSLLRKVPLIIRVDGKSFSKWTKGLKRPFDHELKECMSYTMYKLCKDIDGARFGYTQSDEISILVCDYRDILTQGWFDYRANKIESVVASMATAAFNHACIKIMPEWYRKKGPALFDARAWNLPKEEVNNYAYWRQKDCTKNSISQLARHYFSHKQLIGKNGSELQDMLMVDKSINWNDTPDKFKRGSACYKVLFNLGNEVKRTKWVIDQSIPIFSKDPYYVNKWIEDNPEIKDKDDSKNLYVCEEI